MKVHILTIAWAMLICIQMNAQKIVNKAELYEQAGDYTNAIQLYKTYLKDQPQDYDAAWKLAKVLMKSGDLVQSHSWYASIPETYISNAQFYLEHADLLKRMFRYADAKKRYEQYVLYNPEIGNHYLASLDFAIKSMSDEPRYDWTGIPSNSSSSDFGLTFYRSMPVFSSFREDIVMTENERVLNHDNFALKSFIYSSSLNRLSYIKGVKGLIHHVGPLSFSKNGAKVAIIEDKLKEHNNIMDAFRSPILYIADINDRGEIVASKPFPFNEVGSTINSAHLAFDGTALYFSSNRSGGYGGYDLYVSYWTNNQWGIPKNLGPTINSQGNEVTPFLADNTLYFASDFHVGLGGYDVFMSEVYNGEWSEPYNMGNGVNSPSDDYFPTVNQLGELFIVSNRLGGKGNNDIYKVFEKKPTIKDTYVDVPKAVNLDEMVVNQSNDMEIPAKPNMSDAELPITSTQVAFTLPDFDAKKVGDVDYHVLVGLEGARRIAMDEILPNIEVFFIQLASISSSKPNFDKFKPLLKYGNIYKMIQGNALKIRLGYYAERTEAEDILAKVKTMGYKDAFITYELLNTAKMELVLSSKDDNFYSSEGQFKSKNAELNENLQITNKYKVRLASYEDPIWFDVNKVKDLGRIEQWTKGNWVIFILAGYKSLDEAKEAQIQAINRGFKTAEVVIDNNGVLERLKKN